MHCPYCGNDHADDARFCPVTGKSLAQEQPALCKGCGSPLPSGTAFCPACGLPVRSGPDTVQEAPPAKAPFIALLCCSIGAIVIGLAGLMPRTPANDPAPSAATRPAHLSATPTPWRQATRTPLAPSAATRRLPSPTAVPTRTRTPTATPANGPWLACPDAYKSRLRVGDLAHVSYDPPLANRVRSDASLSASVIGQIRPGEQVKIVKGPECNNRWVWWYVRAIKGGLKGWTSEGDSANYWLVPVP